MPGDAIKEKMFVLYVNSCGDYETKQQWPCFGRDGRDSRDIRSEMIVKVQKLVIYFSYC